MKKDQCVIACLTSPTDADTVLPWARECAKRLGKRLILLNVSAEGKSEWIKEYNLPYIGLKGEWKLAVDGLPTTLNGVLMVTPYSQSAPRSSIKHPATLLHTFADCKTAYLAVGQKSGHDSDDHKAIHQQVAFSSVTLCIDHRRESKEKLIWGSYFVRFFGSRLTVACPDYHDEGLRQHQTDNLRFLDKMYRSLEIEYSKATIPYAPFSSTDLTAQKQLSPNLLISLTTDRRDRDVGDWIIGTPELRLLRQSPNTPILFLNQRDDLYVLCD